MEPEISITNLNNVIKSWQISPRTLPDDFVRLEKVGASGLEDPNLDWLFLTIQQPDKELPATPLALRSRPVKVGDQVYLVGCPYSESNCRQNVYLGKVTARQGDRFRYDIDPPVDLRGFSGAPILDANGHVVGVMTVWFDPKRKDDKYLEAGGEDAASIYSLVEGNP